MIIKEKIGNLASCDVGSRSIERMSIEWYETGKRILHKKTQAGREVSIKFMKENQNLTEDDILWFDDLLVIVVDIQPCEVISITPSTMQEMASLCYEIGNKHLPLFYNNRELLIPFEAPLFQMLTASGYDAKRQTRKLLNQLKTTVSPHVNTESRQGLLSKILQLTTPQADA